MSYWDDYLIPSTVDEALTCLAQYAGQACVIAGGTDLLLELQQGRRPPVAALVDVTRIREMTAIRQIGAAIEIGAAVTHTAITASPLLAQQATCLVESCGVIGGPQVRNVATLGGNVAHALPAGDGTLSLLALGAEAEIAGPGGREWRPLQRLFLGPGRSALDISRELIVRFRFAAAAAGEGAATAFKRIMRPQGVALPVLALAVRVRCAAGRIEQCRIALGPAGPAPLRAEKAEAALRGQALDEAALQAVVEALWSEAILRTSPHRASQAYRREMVEVLARRALTLAVERAQTGRVEPAGVGLA